MRVKRNEASFSTSEFWGGFFAIAYIIAGLATYGSIMGPMVKEHDACVKNAKASSPDFAECWWGPEVLGPFIAGAVWPLYWALHWSAKPFE